MIQKIFSLLAFLCPMFVMAASPAKVKNADKAIIRVTTYDKSGKELKSGYGFFISNSGVALAGFQLFSGAYKAEVVDARGKKWQVTRIEGASDMYDIVKFRTDCSKSEAYTISATPLKEGDVATRFLSDGKKGLTSIATSVKACKTYNQLVYYTLASKSENASEGTPLLDKSGNVVGILQANAENTPTQSFAVDIAVDKILATSALSAGQSALNSIWIPKQLPSDTLQAATYLYLLAKNTQDTASYLTSIADFKAAYPTSAVGYTLQASFLAGQQKYAEAEAVYDEALSKVSNVADIYYNRSKLIYQLNLYKGYEKYKDWDLNKSLADARQANQIQPLPLYSLQEGDCCFALKQYQEAYNIYQSLNTTSFASPQTFFYAARSRELFDNDSTIVLALMDSAMARFHEPYHSDAGPFLLQRAQLRSKYGQYRKSAIDYDTYEKLIGTQNLNDNFFYMKEQVDLNARLYAWALNDIDKALQINPKEYLYLVEKAIIQLRVGEYDEAIYCANQALKVDPNGSDAYKVLGIAYGQKNNKTESLKFLRKAKELGDPQVDEWIEKLK